MVANGPIVSPFAARSAWHLTGWLELATMQQAAGRHLVGTHDFSAFQSTGADVADASRTVTLAEVADSPIGLPRRCRRGPSPAGACWSSTVAANGFLRHMVRAMMGTLAEVGQQRRNPDRVVLLASQNRALADPTAPPRALVG